MKRKYNKGITLIALVITIVILLILVRISVVMITGQNGILKKAEEAKEETRAASVEELKNVWKINKEADKYHDIKNAQDLKALLDDLERQKLITAQERAEIEKTGQVKIGSRIIIFDSSMTLDLAEFESKTTNSITIKVKGSDINYLTYSLYVREKGKDWMLRQTLENQKPSEEVHLIAENLASYTEYDWYVSVTNNEETLNSKIGENIRTKCPSALLKCQGPFLQSVTCPVCFGSTRVPIHCKGGAKTYVTSQTISGQRNCFCCENERCNTS